MPDDKDLGPTNPRISRWLKGVESAINQGTLYGTEEAEKSGSSNRKGQNRPVLRACQLPPRDSFDKNGNIECLNLEAPYAHSSSLNDSSPYNNAITLTLPQIEDVSCRRSLSVLVQNLEAGAEVEGPKDSLMESMSPVIDEESDCQVSITESVNQLCFHDDNEGESLDEDSCKKDRHFITRLGTPVFVNNNQMDPFKCAGYQNGSADLRHLKKNSRVNTPTPYRYEKAKLTLPSLVPCDMRSNADRVLPSITVCQDEESRASKAAQQELSLDPRFLMPTETSVEEARYLLASRRRSLPTFGRGMRARSLDMVLEEQTSDVTLADKAATPLSSLKVPRHRNRSRSLDNSLETNASFAAFKESLKLRNVKNKVLGT